MTSDSDVRRVAEAIGFQSQQSGLVDNEEPFDWFIYPNGRHSNGEPLPVLEADDEAATRWLLPWLTKTNREGRAKTTLMLNGSLWYAVVSNSDGTEYLFAPTESFASALFNLCLAIIQQENPE